ncbi:MAG: thioesterase family protein [Gemella haemolysans]|uniref:thioesterase family protein n=1 Tax=Gemella haemolysans TaxID=1379 RepID=UPI002909B7F6|nr:thioesterase family protein [Gemella haemolysans]MDU6572790.1 thioesterase family protein [Gemella haemolysans]
MKIEINKQFKQNYIVSEYNTAKFMGSGDLNVLATPSLVAFMENAAKIFLNSFLTEDLGSVGSNININHLAPTLVNKEITILGEITEIIKDKIVIFNLEAFEGEKKIGDASHTRVIINNEKFINKLNRE